MPMAMLFVFSFKKMVKTEQVFVLNPRPAGVASRTRIAGGNIYPPPHVISRTKCRRWTREAATKALTKTTLIST